MTNLSEVIWCRDAPPWDEISRLHHPVYAASGIRLRPAIGTALGRTLARPLVATRALFRGASVRELLAFMIWLDTAHCLGVGDVVQADGSPSPLNDAMPRPRGGPVGSDDSRIGVLMIAQNESDTIATALDSVAQIADEIVLVDGGSHDDTRDIARRFGATVYERAFDLDYSAQRNFALGHLTSPWVLQIDADEALTPDAAQLVRQVSGNTDAEVVFIPRINLIGEDPAPFHWPDIQARLFRSHLRYERKLHEQLTGWATAVYTPLSGPYLLHRKSTLRYYQTSLAYAAIAPEQYDAAFLAHARSEVARLESAEGSRGASTH